MVSGEVVGLSQQNDGNNDTVDGDGLTENDTDQILRLDTRHLNGTTQERATCDEDTPKSIEQTIDLTRQRQ
jgi:hypothetical protein